MVAVVSNTGKPLMPTTPCRARKLMKKGRAEIYKYHPFTIRIVDREDGETQDIEFRCDTDAKHIGISIASEKQEYVSAQYDLLPDEKERYDDQRRYRRSRRNRKRYRKPRFDNRKRKKDEFAPSIRHAEDAHIRLFEMYYEVIPINQAVYELGSFDQQVLQAVEQGLPIPQGKDYQRGSQYGIETLRLAVFTRDDFTCTCCGRSTFKDNAILHMHHLGFWYKDHSDRMTNLVTTCEQCHTKPNHQPGGLLWGIKPKTRPFKGAAFMNTVRWHMLNTLIEKFPDVEFRYVYGAFTKLCRRDLHLPKSHANDAYAMGKFHPKHRAHTEYWKKCRQNDCRLQRFYDAKYIDTRDGEIKSGQQLSSSRNSRAKTNVESLRQYRGKKISKGHNAIRKGRTQLKPGSTVIYNNEVLTVKGTHKGKTGTINVEFKEPASDGKKSASLKKLIIISKQYINAWEKVS